MAAVIALANQKGGVGKTTSTYNLGVALADVGQKVLLLDLDPQGGLTYYSGFEPEELGKTIYHCLVRNTSPQEITLRNDYGVDLLPANIDLSLAEFQLVTAPARERRITRIVNAVRDDYDFILIDCQPSLGLLTINALAAADEVIIPVSCEFLSIRGTRALLRLIAKVRGSLNSKLQIAGILPTLFDTRTRHGREVLARLEQEFPQIPLYPHAVARSIRFAESAASQNQYMIPSSKCPGP